MSETLREYKLALRRTMSARRAAVSPERAAAAAQLAAASMMACGAVHRARRVALYAALPDELPSRPLFDALVRGGAETLFPRVRPDRPLQFYAVARWEELSAGAYGVLEPSDGAPAGAFEPGDVVVVPGVAFDSRGHRLGRGGGYYDRTFPRGKSAPILVGFGYDFQLVDAVPHDERDRPVDAIVTERAVHRCASERSA